MIEAYKKFFRNYTNFSGRSTRSDYWYVFLVNFLIGFWTAFICSILGIIEVFLVFYTIYSLATFIPSIALVIRRMHDINMSGWSFFIVTVPIIGPIIILIFLCADSVNENNKYGKNVKNIDNNVKNKKKDIETCNKISKNNDKKDLKNSKKNKRDESESEEEDDDESDSISLVGKLVLGSFLLIVAYNVAGVYFSAKFDNDTNKLNERIEKLEDENAKLIEENTELNSDLLKITGLHTNEYIVDKLEFFDNNIVFVLEGYGNYYYSYDCVQKITNGSYTYWLYHKNEAMRRGYYQGTC